jgi:hypothetical protein
MAVRLTFVRPKAEPHACGPYDEVRFWREQLIADGKMLAHYVDSRWQLAGVADRFSSVEFRDGVEVLFEGKDGARSRAFGPYTAFRLMDGIAYENDHVFASFDREHEDWYSHSLGIHWPMMAVLAATAAPD